MRLIDEEYMAHPFYGYRQMTHRLKNQKYDVNRKRIARLMQIMGLRATVPGPDTSRPAPENPKYPYLLRGLQIERVNHVWSCDITYLPMRKGFLYLFAVIDWYSRYVLSWEISNCMDVGFCLAGLDRALELGKPEIFNTDQGSQFTSLDFTGRLQDAEIKISMDGRGRALDNIFVERLWRSVKYEEVYPKNYESSREVLCGLRDYFEFYNNERPHSAFKGAPPAVGYLSGGGVAPRR